MARIRRAQETGRTDVRLSKEELAAFQRRREREEEEERRRRREQRIAIPLSQLDPGLRKRNSLGDGSPRRLSDQSDGQQNHPSGYFPPSSSRSLRQPTASGSTSRTPSRGAADRDREGSPFTYSYVKPPELSGSTRHASNPAAGRPNSRRSAQEDTASPQIDPFKYMTGGMRAPYHSGSASSRRSVVSATEDVLSYLDSPSGGRPRSPESDGESSPDDGLKQVSRVSSSGSRGRAREGSLLSAERPKHEPEKRSTRDKSPAHAASSSKKSSSTQSPPLRRKSVMSSSTSAKSKRKVK
ncbi:hypothetical protein OQA88_1669 [Cercophora sp. LCS_1]